ncbi:MAG: 50S ribosomal protein L1 [Candidatus Baldrarchaeia archaeon]
MSIPLENFLEAIRKLREVNKKRRFKQSLEILMSFKGIDLNKPENRITANVVLPHPIKKPIKVCVIAEGDLALRAKRETNAHVITRDDLVALEGNKKAIKKLAKQFDFFVAQTDLMPLVGRILGRFLGPRGKMPTPIPPTADIKSIVERFQRMTKIKMRNNPIINTKVGTEDMDDRELAENAKAVVDFVLEKLERGREHLKSVHLKFTMSPTVEVRLR